MAGPPPQRRDGALKLTLRWLITIGTVVGLAWSLHLAVVGSSRLQGAGDTRLTIQSVGLPVGTSVEGRAQVWLDSLIVDGRLVRWEAVRQMGGWAIRARRGRNVPPALLYQGGAGPASVEFQGHRWLATVRASQWAGVIRVEQESTGSRVIEVNALNGPEWQMIIESPLEPASWVVFAAGMAVFSGLAWWWGPIRPHRNLVHWLMLSLVILHLLFWMSQTVGTNTDSPAYLEAAHDVFVEGRPSYFPPGYPALLALVSGLSGQQLGRWMTLVQHGMAVLGGLWIYWLLLRLVPQEFALLGGLLAGSLSPTLTVAQAIVSEMPTNFAMAGAVYWSIRSAESGQRRFAIMAGLLTGWAGTLRVVPLAALLPPLCLFTRGTPNRGWLRQLSLTLITAAIVMLLPIAWCWMKSGQPELARSKGYHLFNRVVTTQRLLDEQAPATSRLLTLLEGMDPRGQAWWTVRHHKRVEDLDDKEAELLFRQVAQEGIRKDFWAFMSYTPSLAWRMLLAPTAWIPVWGDTIAASQVLESPPALAVTAASVAWREILEDISQALWPMLCWSAVAGAVLGLRSPRPGLSLALAWVPVGYLLSSASVESFSPRFNAAIVPFVAALAVIPLAILFDRVSGNHAGDGEAGR